MLNNILIAEINTLFLTARLNCWYPCLFLTKMLLWSLKTLQFVGGLLGLSPGEHHWCLMKVNITHVIFIGNFVKENT